MLLGLLLVQLAKAVCFQPLTKGIIPTEEEQFETAHELLEHTEPIETTEKDLAEVESELPKDVWYVIMRYRIRTKLWFMWPIFFVADLCLTVSYLETERGVNVNIFTASCLWLTVFSSFFMML